YLRSFIVERSEEIPARGGDPVEQRARHGVLGGAREHKLPELFQAKRLLAIKNRALQIFVERDLPGFKCRKRLLVQLLKILGVQREAADRRAALRLIPPVRQYHSANVPEQRLHFTHRSPRRA